MTLLRQRPPAGPRRPAVIVAWLAGASLAVAVTGCATPSPGAVHVQRDGDCFVVRGAIAVTTVRVSARDGQAVEDRQEWRIPGDYHAGVTWDFAASTENPFRGPAHVWLSHDSQAAERPSECQSITGHDLTCQVRLPAWRSAGLQARVMFWDFEFPDTLRTAGWTRFPAPFEVPPWLEGWLASRTACPSR